MASLNVSGGARGLAALAVAASLGVISSPARAQEGDSSRPTSSVSVAAIARLQADIDGGGDFSVNGIAAKGTLGRAFGSRFTAGLTLGYGYEDWRFGTPGALGGAAPWGAIHSPSIGASMRYRYSDTVTFLLSPQVEWEYEKGASTSDAVSYGAVVGALYTYSKTLTVGLGAAAFRQINDTKVFPFVIVNWQINDKLLLSNPLEAGPTGGPGLELTYEINDAWDAGVGVAFREARFRLRRDGPVPNGIGRDKGVPIFAHLSFTPSRALAVDFYAGAIVDGNLRVLNENGSTVSSSDYKAQPVLGIRASYAF
jgi:hypothetical protein